MEVLKSSVVINTHKMKLSVAINTHKILKIQVPNNQVLSQRELIRVINKKLKQELPFLVVDSNKKRKGLLWIRNLKISRRINRIKEKSNSKEVMTQVHNSKNQLRVATLHQVKLPSEKFLLKHIGISKMEISVLKENKFLILID